MINVGVIGLGMGQYHLKGYGASPQARILGIADIDQSRLSACAETYGVSEAFTDYRELLSLPELDAVSIAVPNYLPVELAVEALEAGKHVLVE